MLRIFILRLNDLLSRLRRPRAAAPNVLVLLPHCLRNSVCGRDVVADPSNCGRCGKCNIAGLVGLRDEMGFQLHVASGGRQALGFVRDPSVRVVVAVACEQELYEGILAAFPKPVVAIPNDQPEGPCRNTRVSVEAVRKTLERVILH
jgi:uncharacterized protein